MDRAERVRQALCHKETEIVPYHIDLTGQEHERCLEYMNGADMMCHAGLHMYGMQYSGWPRELDQKPEHFQDAFGVVWNRSGVDKGIGVIEAPVLAEADMTKWREPVLDEVRLRNEYEQVLASKEDKFTFAGIGFSMYERLWSLCGIEQALMNMLAEPVFTEKLLDAICDFNLRIIDIANEYSFDGFYFGDDWGQQRGLIMGPALWKKFIKPRMKKMYDRAQKGGKFILQHSCGDIHELFPDLIEIGLDCYQTFQPEIYDIEVIKQEYGKDLSFWGGVSTQQLLPYATPGQVRDEAKRIMEIMGKGGGYIAGPTHAIPGDVPPENVAALIDVFSNQ